MSRTHDLVKYQLFIKAFNVLCKGINTAWYRTIWKSYISVLFLILTPPFYRNYKQKIVHVRMRLFVETLDTLGNNISNIVLSTI